jgi:hypothetical protein
VSTRASSQVDLVKAFNTVTRELKVNQQSLNAADEYNHNHGDNMVKNFQVITSAMRQKKGALPSDQLEYASQVLAQRSQSGSAQLYSQGLANAADRFKGQRSITPENAMQLVQALMGSDQLSSPAAPPASSGGMDFLGGLLGGQSGQGQGQSQPAGNDMLGDLLGALMGGGAPAAQPSQTSYAPQGGGSPQGGGIDMNMLLNAGMAFFQARQQGAAPVQALVQAVMAGSQMQSSASHSQSGQLVAGTLLNAIGSMLSKQK